MKNGLWQKLLNQQLLQGPALGFPVTIGRCHGPPAGPQENGTKPPQGVTTQLSPDGDNVPATCCVQGAVPTLVAAVIYPSTLPLAVKRCLFTEGAARQSKAAPLVCVCVCFLPVPEPSAWPWSFSMFPETAFHISRGRCVPGTAGAPAERTSSTKTPLENVGLGKALGRGMKLWESP